MSTNHENERRIFIRDWAGTLKPRRWPSGFCGYAWSFVWGLAIIKQSSKCAFSSHSCCYTHALCYTWRGLVGVTRHPSSSNLSQHISPVTLRPAYRKRTRTLRIRCSLLQPNGVPLPDLRYVSVSLQFKEKGYPIWSQRLGHCRKAWVNRNEEVFTSWCYWHIQTRLGIKTMPSPGCWQQLTDSLRIMTTRVALIKRDNWS